MSLAERVLEEEWMDDPSLDFALHDRALRGLRRVNRLSGTSDVLIRSLRKRLSFDPSKPIRILDLACGGGDVTIKLAKSLNAMGARVQIVGWDRSPAAIEISQQLLAGQSRNVQESVTFEVHDVLQDPFGDTFDVIQCTLFLHHLTKEDATALMAKMVRSAKRLVLIDDLRRTRIGLWLAHVACRVLTRSPVVRVDGPMSVRAAFREDEILQMAAQAGVKMPSIRRHWPQRFLLEWETRHDRNGA